MNSKKANVKCISNQGKLFSFPLTIGKVYEEATVIWTEDIQKDGVVRVINDEGKQGEYATTYFELVS